MFWIYFFLVCGLLFTVGATRAESPEWSTLGVLLTGIHTWWFQDSFSFITGYPWYAYVIFVFAYLLFGFLIWSPLRYWLFLKEWKDSEDGLLFKDNKKGLDRYSKEFHEFESDMTDECGDDYFDQLENLRYEASANRDRVYRLKSHLEDYELELGNYEKHMRGGEESEEEYEEDFENTIKKKIEETEKEIEELESEIEEWTQSENHKNWIKYINLKEVFESYERSVRRLSSEIEVSENKSRFIFWGFYWIFDFSLQVLERPFKSLGTFLYHFSVRIYNQIYKRFMDEVLREGEGEKKA